MIERAVEALAERADFLVLAGELPAPDDLLAPIAEMFDPLGYSSQLPVDVTATADALRRTARERLGRDPDIWHIHNHSLGKNGFTPLLAQQLAQTGCRLLLQPHDFAEDGRPDNYRLLKELLGSDTDRVLYPSADHVWYAPINYRDQAFLKELGLQHVHELPNAVTAHPPVLTMPPVTPRSP